MVRNEQTRQYIIEKTASIFNKKGFTGTYLSDLTEATGLSKGSIYGNFKDKNEVAVEAFRYNVNRLTGRLMKKIETIPAAGDKMLFFITFYRRNYRKVFENGGCAILNTAVDADDGNKLLREEVVKAILSWKTTIEHVVDNGITNGELKTVNAGKFACRMIALIEGSILIAKASGNDQYLLNNLDYLEEEVRNMVV